VALTQTVPTDRPWTAPGAARLDGQTLESFMLANTSTDGARFVFALAVRAVFAAEPRDLSLLHALFYLRAGQGIINLTSTAGGPRTRALSAVRSWSRSGWPIASVRGSCCRRRCAGSPRIVAASPSPATPACGARGA